MYIRKVITQLYGNLSPILPKQVQITHFTNHGFSVILEIMSRPIEYTEEVLEEIEKKILAYTESEDVPILAEFAYKNNIRRATLYEHEKLTYAIKQLTAKKEAQLEKLALNSKVNTSMAIFSLKQMGWSDKHEVTVENIAIGKPPELDDAEFPE